MTADKPKHMRTTIRGLLVIMTLAAILAAAFGNLASNSYVMMYIFGYAVITCLLFGKKIFAGFKQFRQEWQKFNDEDFLKRTLENESHVRPALDTEAQAEEFNPAG